MSGNPLLSWSWWTDTLVGSVAAGVAFEVALVLCTTGYWLGERGLAYWRSRRARRLARRQAEAIRKVQGRYRQAFVLTVLHRAEQNLQRQKLAQEQGERS